MLVEYTSLNEISRVYIYPSSRKFYDNEIPIIDDKIKIFLQGLLHINSAFKIKYNRFIVIFISDKTPLTGDQNELLVSFILHLEQQFKVSLLDKVNICFKQGEYVQLKEIPDFKRLIKNKSVSRKTIVFDNLIHSKKEFECCWETSAETSWISHYF